MEKTKKQTRIIKRKEVLEELAMSGRIFCLHHYHSLEEEDIGKHRCYLGNHGKSSCQYLRVTQPNDYRKLKGGRR